MTSDLNASRYNIFRMPTSRNVLINTFSQFIGKLGTVIASLIVVKIVASYGTAFYGNYVTAYEFLAFFGIMADAGLFAIAVRDITRADGKKKPTHSPEFIFGNLLSMRLGLILFFTILAGTVVQLVPNYPDIVKIGVWITGLSMALTIVAGTLSAILQARMKIYWFSGSLFLGKVILAGLIGLIAWQWQADQTLDQLFYTFLWAGVLSNLIFVSLVFYFARREINIRLQFDPAYWAKTFKTSLPYGLALILQTLYLRVDLILISIILGAQAIGIYGIAARIMESFLILGVFFGQAILPKLSHKEDDQAHANYTLYWGAEKLLIFSLPIVIGTWFFASDIVLILSNQEFLTGTAFLGADTILKILIPTVFFAFFNQLFSFALVSKNTQHFLLFVNAGALLLNLALNLHFIPQYGLLAAAASTVFCEILVLAALAWKIDKHFDWELNGWNLALIFGLNAFILSLLSLTPLGQHLLLALPICALIYLGGLGSVWRRFV